MAKKGFLDGYLRNDKLNEFGSAKKWPSALNQRMSNEEAKEILKKAAETPYSILGISEMTTTEVIKKPSAINLRSGILIKMGTVLSRPLKWRKKSLQPILS